MHVREGAGHAKADAVITTVQLSETKLNIPDFALEPEGLWSKLFEQSAGKDIDFVSYPEFSKRYYLRSEHEAQMATFFKEPLIRFLENREQMHIECHNNRLVFYKKKSELAPAEIEFVEKFVQEFVQYAKS